jgi:hypothetical protein
LLLAGITGCWIGGSTAKDVIFCSGPKNALSLLSCGENLIANELVVFSRAIILA